MCLGLCSTGKTYTTFLIISCSCSVWQNFSGILRSWIKTMTDSAVVLHYVCCCAWNSWESRCNHISGIDVKMMCCVDHAAAVVAIVRAASAVTRIFQYREKACRISCLACNLSWPWRGSKGEVDWRIELFLPKLLAIWREKLVRDAVVVAPMSWASLLRLVEYGWQRAWGRWSKWGIIWSDGHSTMRRNWRLRQTGASGERESLWLVVMSESMNLLMNEWMNECIHWYRCCCYGGRGGPFVLWFDCSWWVQ